MTIIIRKDRRSGTYDLFFNDGYGGWAWAEHVARLLRKDLTHALASEEDPKGIAWNVAYQALV